MLALIAGVRQSPSTYIACAYDGLGFGVAEFHLLSGATLSQSCDSVAELLRKLAIVPPWNLPFLNSSELLTINVPLFSSINVVAPVMSTFNQDKKRTLLLKQVMIVGYTLSHLLS